MRHACKIGHISLYNRMICFKINKHTHAHIHYVIYSLTDNIPEKDMILNSFT